MGWAFDALACLERLFLFGFAEIGRLGQGEENDLLAGDGADAMACCGDVPTLETLAAIAAGARMIFAPPP